MNPLIQSQNDSSATFRRSQLRLLCAFAQSAGRDHRPTRLLPATLPPPWAGEALLNLTTGYSNTASGYCRALFKHDRLHNTANGAYALYYNTSGYYNTANGDFALLYNTTGDYNTANGV